MAADQLFIGRLPRSTRSRELEDIFYKYGRMSRCDVKQGVKMSYGFIEYEDMRDAEDAIRNEHGREMGSSRIVVEWARGPKYDYRRDHERHKQERNEFRGSDRHDRSGSRDRGKRRSRSRSRDRSYKRRSRSRSYEKPRSGDRRQSRDQKERRSLSRSGDYKRSSRSRSGDYRRRSKSRSLDYIRSSRSRSGEKRSHSKSVDRSHDQERKRSRSGSMEQATERMSRSRSPSNGDKRSFHSRTPDGSARGREKSQSRSPYKNSHGDAEPED